MENVMVWALSLTVGVFFILARFRFFYDPSKPVGTRWINQTRHESLAHKMVVCGINRAPVAWSWFVAIVEVVGGLMLVLDWYRWVGAALLLCILIRATICTAKQKVCEQNPVDKLDMVCCYLWRVEGLYIVMTALILAATVPL